jgi:uncharacterized membrane protein YsdA (DUF1294 family)
MFQLSLPAVVLLALNVVSLLFFGVDKLKSKRKKLRIPESQLLLTALFAPFGAYAGMLLFRHKIRKIKFLLVPVFLVIQLYLIIRYQIIQIPWI